MAAHKLLLLNYFWGYSIAEKGLSIKTHRYFKGISRQKAGENSTLRMARDIQQLRAVRHIGAAWLAGTFGMSEDTCWDVCTMYYSICEQTAGLRNR